MKQILSRLFNHEHLSEAEARQLLLDITAGRYPDAQVAALLTAFCMRDITVDELTGFREALMQTRVPVDFSPYRPIDIVGTGGDGKNTFNISTCACFVVAGAGYKVAKHGNYGATSVSGSVAAVRKSLGVRTLFNLLGPLVNPCRPAYQLLGVSQLSLMRLYTYVFCKAGIEFAVVNSLDNYDEISLTDEFKVMTRRDERIYRPQELGFDPARPTELQGGESREDASRIFDAVLTNRATPAQTHCVLVNAAFAIQLMEPDKEIGECIDIARRSLESGQALKTLKRFIEINS